MDINDIRNIGGMVGHVTDVLPQSAGAGSVNGTAIDRSAHNMPLSCLLHQAAGAVSGAPSTTSVQTKLQDSADGTTFADYLPDGVNVAETAALSAQNTQNSAAVSLTSARRYIRAVTIVAFTGGTSPAVLVSAGLVLGGETILPAS